MSTPPTAYKALSLLFVLGMIGGAAWVLRPRESKPQKQYAHDTCAVGTWLRTKGYYSMTVTLNADGTGTVSEGTLPAGYQQGQILWGTEPGKMHLYKVSGTAIIARKEGNVEDYACDPLRLSIGPSTFYRQ